MISPFKPPFVLGFPITMSDYQRVVDLNDGPNIQTQLIPTPAWTSVPTPFSHVATCDNTRRRDVETSKSCFKYSWQIHQSWFPTKKCQNKTQGSHIPTNSSRQKKVPNLPVGVYFCQFPEKMPRPKKKPRLINFCMVLSCCSVQKNVSNTILPNSVFFRLDSGFCRLTSG